MKKIILISCILMAVVIIAAIAAVVLITPEDVMLLGSYSDIEIGTGTIFEFSDDRVSVTYMSMNVKVGEATGTYRIENDLITMEFEESSNVADMYSGEHTVEIRDDCIVIDEVVYRKKAES